MLDFETKFFKILGHFKLSSNMAIGAARDVVSVWQHKRGVISELDDHRKRTDNAELTLRHANYSVHHFYGAKTKRRIFMNEAVYLLSRILVDENPAFPNDRVTRNYLG